MKNKDIPLSHLDLLMWNTNHPTGLTNITAIKFFKAPLDTQKVIDIFEKKILKFEKFQEKVIIKDGKPTWHKDELFNLQSHIHKIALPGKGDDKALQILISDLISSPLDYSKPLWQIHIIENYNSGTAVLWRIGHVIGDGVSLMTTFLSITDNFDPEKDTFHKIKKHHVEHEATKKIDWRKKWEQAVELSKKTIEKSKSLIQNPQPIQQAFEALKQTTKDLTSFVMSSSNAKSMYKGPLGVQKKVAWSKVIPLSDIKKIGKHYGSTVNDTLLVALTGAIRKHMLKHGQDLNIKFNVACPVDMRKQDVEIDLGNKIGVILLDLPINEGNIKHRFKVISEKTKSLRRSLEPPITYYYTQFISDFIPKGMEEAGAKFLGSKLMAILSNVPGPKRALNFAGEEIDNLMFFLPHTYEMGIGLSVISYNNKVTLGITVDANIVNDPETIAEYFEAEIELMLATILL
ncbi:MAG: WS/DGAT domain-containing protein [Chitinophagales bacterium]